MYDQTTSIEEFLAAAASRQPTPGGGAVAALAGALAAAIGEMAVHYSIGKKGLESHDPEFKSAVAEFQRARQLLLELMREDQSAYDLYASTRKMPDSADKTQTANVALLACIRVPQSMAATALATLELAEKLSVSVNPYLLSDLAVCAEMAIATLRCAVYNVRVNLPQVSDVEERRRLESQNQQWLERATKIIQKVIPGIWRRLAEKS